MAISDTTVKFRADISNLKAGMQAASRSVRLATTEFKRATADLDDWSKSEKGLTEKVKQLNTTLAAQKKQAALAREEWEKTKVVFGENSAEAERAKMRLNQYETSVKKTEKELGYYENELKDCKNETGNFAKSTDEAEKAMKDASEGFTVAKAALASLVADGIRLAISALKDLAKETITAGMNFEKEMSKVQAISGATSEDMEALTAKAKEMGETTVFSASESAQAFEYMAMAGWKTEDMLNGIEGIMNLAAASGESLATTSDIVTDALTAFGLEAKDAGHFADVLAAASTNANTNVAMLGESFKYVAPVAGSLGFSVEDVSTALSLMANSGIKASTAGTSLRQLLTNMAKPTKTASEAMKKLGISLDDGKGNMKSFGEIMKELRSGFGNLKMPMDQFQQQVKKLDSDLEQGSITEDEYNKQMKTLTESAYGAEGALKAEAAASLAGTRGMSGLLAIVNTTDDDFNKLTTAINGATGAAQGMADVMTDNVAGDITLLKSKVEGIMIKVFEKASGSIRQAIDTISKTLDTIDWDAVADAIGNIAKKAADFLAWCVRNSDVIIEIIKSVVKVAATLWAVKKVIAFSSAVNTAITAVKGIVAAIKAGEAASIAASASGGALAALVSPGGAIVLGLTAIAAVTATIISLTKDEAEEIQVLTAEQQASIEASHELFDSYNNMETARKESMAAIQSEYAHYTELVDELDSLVNANGQVKKGQEDRARFIVTTLNDALGTEMEMTGNVISNYKTERAEIEKLMQTKKAQAILNANEAAYTEAIGKQSEALATYASAQNTLNELRKKETEIDAQVSAAEEELSRLWGESPIKAAQYAEANEELFQSQRKLKEEIGNAVIALNEADTAYTGINQTIKNYEGLSAAIISGDAKKIQNALDSVESGFRDHKTASARILKAQADELRARYEDIRKAFEAGDKSISKDQVDQAKRLADQAEKEYKLAGENAGEGYVTGVEHYVDIAKSSAGKVGQASLDGLKNTLDENSPSKKTYESGANFGQGFINGMDSKSSAVYQRAYQLGKTAIEALKKAQKEHSPSKLTYLSGVNFVKGYVNGITSLEKSLVKTVQGMVSRVLKTGLRVSKGNFTDAADTAGTVLANAITQKTDYMTKRMEYQSEQRLNAFEAEINMLSKRQEKEIAAAEAKTEKTVSGLEASYNRDIAYLEKQIEKTEDKTEKKKLKKQLQRIKERQKKEVAAERSKGEAIVAEITKNYDKLISEVEKKETAYSKASEEFLDSFRNAVDQYSTKAQQLVESTMENIASKYQEQYDELVEKRDSLAAKLFSAGSLFDVSGAGVLTINDLDEQTKQIQDYSKQLLKIKNKVSDALFDEIANLDMREGKAYLTELLSMSDKELKAYSDSYDAKLAAAQKAAQKTYAKDIKATKAAYKEEMKEAFKDLPAQLETLGESIMKGFVTGLTKDTGFMSKQIKAYVKELVKTFKKDLKIASPSKVMMEIGAYTGEGFVEGLKDTIRSAQKAASNLAASVASPMQAASIQTGGFGASGGGITNNYNLVQNNTSPKPLTALETYRARRQQIAMVKALT